MKTRVLFVVLVVASGCASQAPTAGSCKDITECRAEGMCTEKDGFCVVAFSSDCEKATACLYSGRCTASEGACIATSDGDCKTSSNCDAAGECYAIDGVCTACAPQCDGKECGEDACGGLCGTCPAAAPVCSAGVCGAKCEPSCSGKQCGADGCGGDCGSCTGITTCVAGTCVAECQDECSGLSCESGKEVGCVKSPNGCWQKSTPVSCDDGNVCTKDSCGSGGCKSAPASNTTSCGPVNSCSGGVCVVDPKKQPSVTITKHRLPTWSDTNPTLFGFLHHLYGKPLGTSSSNDMLELEVSNPGGASVQVTVEVKVVGYSETWSKSVQVGAGKSVPVNVPSLQLNSTWASLAAKVSPQLQVQLLQNGEIAYSSGLTIDLYPRNSVHWGEIPGFGIEFNGMDAVVTLGTPSSPAVGELTASAKNFSVFKAILGYQCAGAAWGNGSTPALTANLAPGQSVYWQTWYKKGEVVALNVSVTCSVCMDYNAQYWIQDGDGAAIFSKVTLGSVTQAVTIPAEGWYYHFAKNPSTNSSNRAFTVKRGVAASECAADQLMALYLALQAKGFGYTSVGTDFFSYAQYVKPIEKTWKDKAGNCIDGTLLFAAALEAMGMEPLLAFPPGHALVGVRCAQGAQCTVPIETTAIGAGTSASDAVAKGIDNFNKAEYVTDVKAMRQFGFAPLP